MFLLPLLLAALQEAPTPAAPPDDWSTLPTFVVPALSLEDADFIEHVRRSTGDDVHVTATRIDPATLDILVSDFDHLSGDDVRFRLTVAPDGILHAEACSTWHSDVADPTSGPNADVHGMLLVESRAPDATDPLRLSFRLSATVSGFLDRPDPVVLSGAATIPLDELGWTLAITAPALPDATRSFAESDLREVQSTWPDGDPRAHGWLDPLGFREGLWTTWSADGIKQTEAIYVRGERTGIWTGYRPDGVLREHGRLDRGLRTGEWHEIDRHGNRHVTRTGSYADGRREGEWIGQWDLGKLRSQGSYRDGRETGHWIQWWPDGTKQWEGDYDDGDPVGTWTYWNEDGSLRETKVRVKPWWRRR